MTDLVEWLRAALARYAEPGVPRHGTGSLPHGYVDGRCGDHCNNIQCPMRETHERCTVDCLTAAGPRLLEVPVWRGLLLGIPLDLDLDTTKTKPLMHESGTIPTWDDDRD